MPRAVARRVDGYAHDVEIDDGEHTLRIDEPAESGGTDTGPRPTRVLAAALAACTAITVEMYADRKGWDVGKLQVEVETEYEGPVPASFTVTLHLPGGLGEEQLERLRVIAGKCPVHKALASETEVTITDRIAPL
jgi:putative redox protein